MGQAIKVGIVGYGNLGKGVEQAIQQNPDMELVAVFTRRTPDRIANNSVKMLHVSEADAFQGKVDVMILCGGSATDLPQQAPEFAAKFNTVDSMDTHAKIPEYYGTIDPIAKANGRISVISTGWDPGLFSLNRLLGEVILPEGSEYTFWGKGLSQGHSDAIRRVDGVRNGAQYTIPINEAINKVRAGENPKLLTRDKHLRECYIVAEQGADQARIEHEIKTMPNYFVDYDTEVHFISEEEFKENHSAMPHGGFVLRSGVTGAAVKPNKHIIEFGLKLESNPEFTASVLVACARAAVRMNREGLSGAKTVFDIPFAYLSPHSGEELRKRLL